MLALARLDLDAESLDKQPDGLQHVLSGLFLDEVGTLPLLNNVVVTLAVSAEHALGTTDVPKLQRVAMGGSDVSDEMLLGNRCAHSTTVLLNTMTTPTTTGTTTSD